MEETTMKRRKLNPKPKNPVLSNEIVPKIEKTAASINPVQVAKTNVRKSQQNRQSTQAQLLEKMRKLKGMAFGQRKAPMSEAERASFLGPVPLMRKNAKQTNNSTPTKNGNTGRLKKTASAEKNQQSLLKINNLNRLLQGKQTNSRKRISNSTASRNGSVGKNVRRPLAKDKNFAMPHNDAISIESFMDSNNLSIHRDLIGNTSPTQLNRYQVAAVEIERSLHECAVPGTIRITFHDKELTPEFVKTLSSGIEKVLTHNFTCPRNAYVTLKNTADIQKTRSEIESKTLFGIPITVEPVRVFGREYIEPVIDSIEPNILIVKNCPTTKSLDYYKSMFKESSSCTLTASRGLNRGVLEVTFPSANSAIEAFRKHFTTTINHAPLEIQFKRRELPNNERYFNNTPPNHLSNLMNVTSSSPELNIPVIPDLVWDEYVNHTVEYSSLQSPNQLTVPVNGNITVETNTPAESIPENNITNPKNLDSVNENGVTVKHEEIEPETTNKNGLEPERQSNINVPQQPDEEGHSSPIEVIPNNVPLISLTDEESDIDWRELEEDEIEEDVRRINEKNPTPPQITLEANSLWYQWEQIREKTLLETNIKTEIVDTPIDNISGVTTDHITSDTIDNGPSMDDDSDESILSDVDRLQETVFGTN